MDAVHGEGIQPGSVRQGPQLREGAMGTFRDAEECVNELWMGQMVSERNRGGVGGDYRSGQRVGIN